MLLAAAAAAGVVVDSPATQPPPIPSVDAVTAGAGWSVVKSYQPVPLTLSYQQWLLTDGHGTQAQLFIGTTSRPQTIYEWWGEFGYLGGGYLVERSSVNAIHVGTESGRMTAVRIRHGADVKDVAYAVKRPDGIVATGSDLPMGLAWDALTRRGSPYYAVRVTVTAANGPAPSSAATAATLLTTVLGSLTRAT